MVRRGHGDDVHVLRVEHFAEVGKALNLMAILVELLEGFAIEGAGEYGWVNIADCRQLKARNRRGHLDVQLAASVQTDHAETDLVVGTPALGRRPSCRRESGWNTPHRRQETPDGSVWTWLDSWGTGEGGARGVGQPTGASVAGQTLLVKNEGGRIQPTFAVPPRGHESVGLCRHERLRILARSVSQGSPRLRFGLLTRRYAARRRVAAAVATRSISARGLSCSVFRPSLRAPSTKTSDRSCRNRGNEEPRPRMLGRI